MDPVKMWSGVIGGDVRSWRQILVRSLEDHSVLYAIGASQQVDIIAAVKVDKDGTVDVQQRELPMMQSSRLISVHPAIAVQDSKGEIYECVFPCSSYPFSKAHIKQLIPRL
jgi:cysteine sulfinate desulfinase/cysteine desulfurase-like protein